MDERAIEAAAKALCKWDGGRWDAAHFNETPNGCSPSEMRENYIETAKVAVNAYFAFIKSQSEQED